MVNVNKMYTYITKFVELLINSNFSIHLFETACTSFFFQIALIYTQSSFHHDNLQRFRLLKIAYPPFDTLSLFKTSFSTATLLKMFLTCSSARGINPRKVLCKILHCKWAFSTVSSTAAHFDNLNSFLTASKVYPDLCMSCVSF